jgi:hypothetical protein
LSLVSSILGDVVQFVELHQIEKAQRLLEEKIEAYHIEGVQGRRKKVTEINRSIVQIDIEIKKMDIHYRLIKNSLPSAIISTIDAYVYDLKKKRAELEINKREYTIIRFRSNE